MIGVGEGVTDGVFDTKGLAVGEEEGVVGVGDGESGIIPGEYVTDGEGVIEEEDEGEALGEIESEADALGEGETLGDGDRSGISGITVGAARQFVVESSKNCLNNTASLEEK